MSAIFSAKSPPKPQHVSASGSGQTSAPRMLVHEYAWLAGETEAAKAVAGRVIGEAAIEAGADVGDAQDVDEKRGQLVGPRGQRLGTVGVVGIVGEQVRRLVDHHVAARPGRNDHRRLALAKHVDHVSRHRARVVPAAGVERRLTAAGLPARHVHLDPRPFEHADDGKPDVGARGCRSGR